MNMKLTSLFGAALMLGAGLFTLLSATGCGSVYTENVSERPWAESHGPPSVLGDPRRDDRR